VSWPLVKLADICTTTQGVQITKANTKDKAYDGGYRYLYIADFISNKKLSFVDDVFDHKKVTENDLVMANTGSPGRVFKGKKGILSNNLFKISFDLKVVDRNYLYLMLSSNVFQNVLQDQMKGGIQKHLGHQTISRQEIPLPPLAEQKRIAAILDKADAIRRKRKQAIQLADDFLRSVFLDMFGDPVTNPKGFPIGTIRDFVETANYGSSGKASETEGEFPILRMGNITYEGGWNFSSLKYIDLSDKDKPKYLAQKGDLLFNRTNSKELVGKTAVFEEDIPMAIAGYLVRVRPNQLGNNYYLSGYLNSLHGKKTLVGMCKSIVGMANINAQELQNIEIMLPSKKLQDNFESIVKSTNEKLKNFKKSEILLSDSFNSLRQKAFAGEL
tara:strand:- start:47946 stop:49103 length:1158 start_codon:yes stop_codon:yes gene_type:complete